MLNHGGGRNEGERWARMFERQAARAHLIERWLKALGVGPATVLADLGCGPGLASLMAARMAAPGGRIYAVDADDGALAFLMERYAEARREGAALAELRPVTGDVATVSLPEPVDCLLMTHLLHHVVDPLAVVRQARALVRPQGVGVVAEFDPEAPGEIGPPLERRIPRATLKGWLDVGGWRVEATLTDEEEQYAWLISPSS